MINLCSNDGNVTFEEFYKMASGMSYYDEAMNGGSNLKRSRILEKNNYNNHEIMHSFISLNKFYEDKLLEILENMQNNIDKCKCDCDYATFLSVFQLNNFEENEKVFNFYKMLCSDRFILR